MVRRAADVRREPATLAGGSPPGPPDFEIERVDGRQALARWKPGGVQMELHLDDDRAKVSSI
jgi:hypothetical protein